MSSQKMSKVNKVKALTTTEKCFLGQQLLRIVRSKQERLVQNREHNTRPA